MGKKQNRRGKKQTRGNQKTDGGIVEQLTESLKRKIPYDGIQVYETRFNFIRNHLGIRPGCFHVLLGRPNEGKSTLAKTIAADVAETKTCFVWLAEEIPEVYFRGFNDRFPKSTQQNISTFCERREWPRTDLKIDSAISILRQQIVESGAGVIIIDNLTASRICDERYGVAGIAKAVQCLTELCEQTGVAIFALIHTTKQLNPNMLIQLENTRGTNKTAILAEYFYIMQAFESNGKRHTFIRVVKSRYHPSAVNKAYKINFNREKIVYESDTEVSFEDLNTAFKDRDYLGRSSNAPDRSAIAGKKDIRNFWN